MKTNENGARNLVHTAFGANRLCRAYVHDARASTVDGSAVRREYAVIYFRVDTVRAYERVAGRYSSGCRHENGGGGGRYRRVAIISRLFRGRNLCCAKKQSGNLLSGDRVTYRRRRLRVHKATAKKRRGGGRERDGVGQR